MKPKEVFAQLCTDLKITDPEEQSKVEIFFKKGYEKGRDDEWARICVRIEDEL